MVALAEDLKQALKFLESGGVILYPTETVWGLGCDALNEAAVEQIFRIKNRPESKSLIVLLAEAKDIFQFTATPHPDVVHILESFQKPTTIIYENALHFPKNVVADDGSIGIRITTDPFCKSLIKRLKRPIISTSANISGSPAPNGFSEIADEIKSNVDYVVHYRREDTAINPPSRIVKIKEDGSLEILRA